MSGDCPVCILAATNVSAEDLRNWVCHQCGGALSSHRFEQRKNVKPSMAFAVNPELLSRYP